MKLLDPDFDYISVFGLLTGLVLLLLIARLYGKPHQHAGGYEAKHPALLTAPERELFELLRTIMPGHRIFVQVALNQLVKVSRNVRHNKFQMVMLNRISNMSLDFVVCRPDLTVLLCIELDDASHKHNKRIQADKHKNQALESAQIPLLRLRKMPNASELNDMLASHN